MSVYYVIIGTMSCYYFISSSKNSAHVIDEQIKAQKLHDFPKGTVRQVPLGRWS